MSHFDDNDDLWIDIALPTRELPGVPIASFARSHQVMPGVYAAMTQINLTQYLKQLIYFEIEIARHRTPTIPSPDSQ